MKSPVLDRVHFEILQRNFFFFLFSINIRTRKMRSPVFNRILQRKNIFVLYVLILEWEEWNQLYLIEFEAKKFKVKLFV